MLFHFGLKILARCLGQEQHLLPKQVQSVRYSTAPIWEM